MAETISAQCGFCRKPFRLTADQLNHEVRCPHCKFIVKITSRTESAMQVAQALRETEAKPTAATGRRPAPPLRRGVRSKSVAIVWAALLGVAAIVLSIGLWKVFGPGRSESNQPSMQRMKDERPTSPAPRSLPAAGSGEATGGKVPEPGAPPTAGGETLMVRVERVLGGFQDERVTYAVGHVTNSMSQPVRVLKVVVDLKDFASNPVGRAEAILLNVPPNTTVPLLAECVHAEGLRATQWGAPKLEVNPAGVPQELPPLVAKDPWAHRDPNVITPTGIVKVNVTNRGVVPVTSLEAVAILIGSDGAIVGAAKNVISQEIKPGKSEEISIHWDHCAGSRVFSAEAWVQPSR